MTAEAGAASGLRAYAEEVMKQLSCTDARNVKRVTAELSRNVVGVAVSGSLGQGGWRGGGGPVPKRGTAGGEPPFGTGRPREQGRGRADAAASVAR